jgi:hypothetical protein
MYAICLGSRRACACSKAGFNSQNGDRDTEEQRSVVHFLWAKGLNAKVIHKEMFPIYGRKCLSCKAVHNWMANVSLMTRLKPRCGSGGDNSQKRLLCCGFRRTGKAIRQVYQCWWRICREIRVFFSRFEVPLLRNDREKEYALLGNGR